MFGLPACAWAQEFVRPDSAAQVFKQWLAAYNSGEPGWQAMATSPQNNKGWYGYGFMVSGHGVERQYGHDGSAPGANAALVVLLESGYVMIGLSNVDPGAMENIVNFNVHRLPL